MRAARIMIAVIMLSGCALRSGGPDAPAEAARHRAALAGVTVVNQTTLRLSIAFRTATPPVQDVVIGRVGPGERARMAPIPAGEPIFLVARRADGTEYQLQAQSYAVDADFVWDIPTDATFKTPERRK